MTSTTGSQSSSSVHEPEASGRTPSLGQQALCKHPCVTPLGIQAATFAVEQFLLAFKTVREWRCRKSSGPPAERLPFRCRYRVGGDLPSLSSLLSFSAYEAMETLRVSTKAETWPSRRGLQTPPQLWKAGEVGGFLFRRHSVTSGDWNEVAGLTRASWAG